MTLTEEEDFPHLDDKKKEQIILELKNEIKKQKEIYLYKGQNILDEMNKENDISVEQKNINKNKNELLDNSPKMLTININPEKNPKDNAIFENEEYLNKNINYETNLIFKEINNFILKNNQKINNEKSLLFSFGNDKINDFNELKKLPLQQPKMADLLEKQKIAINSSNNLNISKEDIKKKDYINQINYKKNILFSEISLNNKNQIEINKVNQIKKNNLFNNKSKLKNKIDTSKSIKNTYIRYSKKIKKKNNKVKEQKSANKIEKNFSNINLKKKSVPHNIVPNEKSMEKFKKIQLEINNKFNEEYTFKPNLFKKKNDKETKEERYQRLSRPKSYEIKGNHLIKNEEQKLNAKININNKINPKNVSNRLYKLHQQIRNKKAQIQKIFEEKQMDECTFAPKLNNYSKKIMNRTYSNIHFNERNDNFIKQKKENMIKLCEEIDKKAKEKSIPKINEESKIILANQYNNNYINDINVYNRLYENNYYSNNNINLNENNNDLTDIKLNNKMHGIKGFLERQKIFENLKKENLNRYKQDNMYDNEKNEELTFIPKINSTSDLIVKINSQRMEEDIDDKYKRLYDEAEKIKQKKEELKFLYDSKYDFTPKINELSKIICTNIFYNKDNITNNKIRRRIIKNEIDNECTFKPKCLNNEKYKNIKSNYKYDNNMAEKIQVELNNKNNKINILKSEKLYNYLKECRFAPHINKNISNFNTNDDIYYQSGLKTYINRMEKSKQTKKEQEEREKKIFLTGENWRPKDIKKIPKPFNLSINNNKIKIEKIKEEIKNEEMKECSFKPITNESKTKNIVKKILNEK